MPFIKAYIHFIWSIKDRIPFLETKDIRQQMWQHIRGNTVKKGIFIDFINGYSDHCHCLVSLSVDQTIEKVMQLREASTSQNISGGI